jgi:acyl-CoA synthetase (AMP-forming)/AMP-acid ligase II
MVNYLGWLHEYEPTWYVATPVVHSRIVELLKRDPDRRPLKLRFIRSGGAPIQEKLKKDLEELTKAPVINGYAMTESFISANPQPPGLRKEGSAGVAFGVDVAIMNDDGGLQKPGESGEIVIKGPSVFHGYENNPDANEQCFTGGWFRTGDLGYVDGDGYIFIAGRKKELINLGGEKISPYRIEEALMKNPAIREVAAFPVPNAVLGEEVGAAVVLEPGHCTTREDIRRFAARILQFNEVPSRIVIVDEIPKKGVSSKIRRNDLYNDLKGEIHSK